MPEAIATTKRKFHRLLDNLTNLANGTATVIESTTPLTARDKLIQANDRVKKRQRLDGSPRSLESRYYGSIISLPSAQVKKAADTQDTTSRFSPWSQAMFLQRLQTFSGIAKWHPKPSAINEVAWAKRGWTNVDYNVVGCEMCGKRVLVALSHKSAGNGPREEGREEQNEEQEAHEMYDDEQDDDDDGFQQALVERYGREIVQAHTEECLWRASGCHDDIQKLQIVRPSVWQPALKQRFLSLLAISASIKDPKLQHDENETQLPLETVLAETPEDVLPPDQNTNEVRLRALDIAMHGWRGITTYGTDMLTCDSCFSRIGLWLYQPGYRPRHFEPGDPEDYGDAVLKLVDMHRPYCPWQSTDTQQASGNLTGLNGCQIMPRVISTFIKERRRKTLDEYAVTDEAITDVLPRPSQQEVEQQDRELETRLQKLKNMLSFKRPARKSAT